MKLLVNALKSILLPVVVFVIFTILTRGRVANFRVILAVARQSVVPIIICWALVLTMTLGIMNFAAGGIVLCATIMGGNIAKLTYSGFPGLVLFCVAAALILAFIMGTLYNFMKIPGLVLAIGLVLIYESIPRIFFRGGVTIARANTFLSLSPWCFIVLAVMGAIFYIIYNKTAFGHNLRALGSSPTISNSVGLDSAKIKFMCFMVGGFFFGVAAVLHGSNQGQVLNVVAMGSMTIMMDAFMGVFLAFFLTKWCNLTFAVVIGNVTMKMINNGFVSLGLTSTVRDITTGIFLFVLLAMSANEGFMQKIRERNANAEKANKKYAQREAIT
jgi:ribose transport system permease protein